MRLSQAWHVFSAKGTVSCKPDTVSTVIQPLDRGAAKSSPQKRPAVNNCAAAKMKRSEKLSRPRHDRAGRIAPAGSRSCKPHLAKVSPSAPVPLAVSVPKSERTIAREAPCIRLTFDRATMHYKNGEPMKAWKEITHYAGFDWARDHHVVVVVDRQGQIVADFQFDHSVEGWKSFRQKTTALEIVA